MTNYETKQLSKWKKCKDELPPEGKYVLGRHNRGTWHDSSDQVNMNCIVVKLVKGISIKTRELMKNGTIKDPVEPGYIYDSDKGIRTNSTRSNSFHKEDEWGNNLKPYCWDQFGPDYFFGQDIYEWAYIPVED